MAFFSPFTDAAGQPKMIFELVPADLQQLHEKHVEEGWQIQYGTMLSKKVVEVICSFANELGGWLIIGIDAETLEPVPQPDQDYEALLNGFVRETMNPVPKIEVRFLETNRETHEGVLVVWVPEGSRPPYVCNGSIFRRSGSGTLAVKHNDQLDKLYVKARETKAEVEGFCRNELTVNNAQWNSQIFRYIERGMCNIYLLPVYPLNLAGRMCADEWVDAVLNSSKKPMVLKDSEEQTITFTQTWAAGYYSVNSLIFRNSPLLDHYRHSAAWELFMDGRTRFHLPIPYIDLELHLWKDIKNVQKKDILNDFHYIDGKELLTQILSCISCYSQLMKKYFHCFNEVKVVLELENVERDVLIFKGDSYLRYLREKGLFFSEKTHYLINHDCAQLTTSMDVTELMKYISPVFNAFGLSEENGTRFFYEVLRESSDFPCYAMNSR